MPQVKNGDTVKVHYTGKLEDGTEFDTSTGGDPLQFTLGGNQVIPGFEKAVIDMEPGDSKTFTIPMEEGYGPYRQDLVAIMAPEEFPENMKLEIGQQLEIRKDDSQVFLVRITDISDAGVTLDANHALAGKDLTFDIELVEIV